MKRIALLLVLVLLAATAGAQISSNVAVYAVMVYSNGAIAWPTNAAWFWDTNGVARWTDTNSLAGTGLVYATFVKITDTNTLAGTGLVWATFARINDTNTLASTNWVSGLFARLADTNVFANTNWVHATFMKPSTLVTGSHVYATYSSQTMSRVAADFVTLGPAAFVATTNATSAAEEAALQGDFLTNSMHNGKSCYIHQSADYWLWWNGVDSWDISTKTGLVGTTYWTLNNATPDGTYTRNGSTEEIVLAAGGTKTSVSRVDVALWNAIAWALRNITNSGASSCVVTNVDPSKAPYVTNRLFYSQWGTLTNRVSP